jgi:rubrerythrin
MSRVLAPREDWQVVIRPNSWTWATKPADRARVLEQRCDEIVKAVKRHIDDIEAVWAEAPENPVCGHCGSTWTEDDASYNGGCCQADQDAFEAAGQVQS